METLLKGMIWGYPYFWKHPKDVKSRDNDNVSHFSRKCLNVFVFFSVETCWKWHVSLPATKHKLFIMNEQNFIALWKSSESYPRAKGYPPYNLMKGYLWAVIHHSCRKLSLKHLGLRVTHGRLHMVIVGQLMFSQYLLINGFFAGSGWRKEPIDTWYCYQLNDYIGTNPTFYPKLQKVPVTLRVFCNLPLMVGTGFRNPRCRRCSIPARQKRLCSTPGLHWIAWCWTFSSQLIPPEIMARLNLPSP